MNKKHLLIISIFLCLTFSIYQYGDILRLELAKAYDASKPANGHNWSEMQCTSDLCITDGKIGIGTDAPATKLDVVGAIKLGNDATVCSATNAGAVRWTGSYFEGCDGTNWTFFSEKVCEDGWIPFNGKCYMKYEAKDVGGVPTSQTSGNPWVSITQTSAIAECASIGAHLITNAEWMALAHDIESVSSNWEAGILARGFAANTGYGDTWTNSAVAPSTGVGSEYNTATNTVGASGTHLYRRTHTLSNGEVIWDLSGNVYEWTNDTRTTAQLLSNFSSQTSSWYEYDGTVAGFSTADFSSDRYIPYLSVAPSTGVYNSDNGIGRIYIDTNTASPSGDIHAFLRGGGWDRGAYAGVFTLDLGTSPAYSRASVGFRCAR